MNIAAVLIAVLGLTFQLQSSETLRIGSGHPGLKVISKKNLLAIYQDEPQAVGVGWLCGKDRDIKLIYDNGLKFSPPPVGFDPVQLFPLDADSAFTCSGGTWVSDPHRFDCSKNRKYRGYRLTNGELSIIENVQDEARLKYCLNPKDEFLGYVDGHVFFWRDFDTRHIYWKDLSSSKTYVTNLSKKILDIYGIAHTAKQGIGVLVFRRTPGLIHWYPNTWSFLELDISKSKIVNTPNP